MQEAIDRGLVEPAAVFVVDTTLPGGGQFTTLAALMQRSFTDDDNDSRVDNDMQNCCFDPATGVLVNAQTGETLSLADAISAGLIGDPGGDVERMSTNMAVLKALGEGHGLDTSQTGIRDPRTGDELSLPAAIQAGLVDLASGEFVNPDTGERLARHSSCSVFRH